MSGLLKSLAGGLGMGSAKKLFGGGSSNPSTFASDTYAALTREQWADYVKTFVPIENQLIDYTMNPSTVSNAMSDASSRVNASFDAQQASTNRRLQGLGLELNTDEQVAQQRSFGLARSLADVQAQNFARDATMQRQQSILGNPAPNTASMAKG